MKTILLIAAVVFSTQALATVTDILPSYSFQPSEDTKVLQVNLRTINGVSCPGSLDLFLKSDYDGDAVEYRAAEETKNFNKLIEPLSSSCKSEVLENRFNKQPIAICLSYGFAYGTVYIPVANGEEVTFDLPINLTVDEVVELK